MESKVYSRLERKKQRRMEQGKRPFKDETEKRIMHRAFQKAMKNMLFMHKDTKEIVFGYHRDKTALDDYILLKREEIKLLRKNMMVYADMADLLSDFYASKIAGRIYNVDLSTKPKPTKKKIKKVDVPPIAPDEMPQPEAMRVNADMVRLQPVVANRPNARRGRLPDGGYWFQ